MRLFIAINLNEETKSELISMQNELRAHSKGGNYTLPENLHLTIAFIGDCDIKQTAQIKAIMDIAPFQSFELIIEQIGRFKRDSGDTWWAGVQESKPLIQLQRNLTNGLLASGFSIDTRKYSPHITLGRKVITNYIPQPITPFGESVSSIDLMKSERVGGKLTYTKIHSKN